MSDHEFVEIQIQRGKDHSLEKYYDIEEHETEWRYFCKVCKKGWSLSKESIHPGNQIFLINHAYGHLPNRRTTLRMPIR